MRLVALASLAAVACSTHAPAPDAPLGIHTVESPPQSPGTAAPPPPAAPARIDVHDEGAAGDGATDDADAIERALAMGVATGLPVFFPPARYRLGRVVAVSVDRALVVVAAGATLAGDALAPDDEVGLLDLAGTGDVTIHGLAVELAATDRGNLDGMRLHGGMSSVVLDGVAARGASRWGVAVSEARSGTITGCRAVDNRYGGLGLEASRGIAVEGGELSFNGTTAPVDGYGVSCMSSAIGPCVDVTIHGVHAVDNKRKGIDVHSGHSIVVDSNAVSGFESSGIYAVNEDPGKDVKDVTITNNVIDGAGASHYVYGVEIGAFSALATDSGSFVVRGNTIKNTSFTTSSAILIRNPISPGLAPSSVTVEGNTIVNGAAPDAYVIRGDNYDVPVGSVVVKDNVLGASSAAVGIGLLRVSSALVSGNAIAIDAGSVAYGILVSPPATATIEKNALSGAATYETPIATSPGQTAQGDTLRGAPLD